MDIISNAIMFYIAGYETTAVTSTYALYNLALNPDVQVRLAVEIDEALAKTGVSRNEIRLVMNHESFRARSRMR